MTADVGAIAIDWGTTNVRAWRLDASGAVLARRAEPKGILNVEGGAFAAAFDELVGDWRRGAPDAPTVLSGMIGSRQGWIEAPYMTCPAALDALARHAVAVPDHENAVIVPGVATSQDGRHDVMRGEEVQIYGALSAHGGDDATVCLPGTHSKWARVSAGRLTGFATSMTGEVYDALSRHTILGRLMSPAAADDDPGDRYFGQGLERSGEAGGLLHHVFGVRAAGLFDALPPHGMRGYLSGLLLGHEVRAMAAMMAPPGAVAVIAAPALATRYRTALEHVGLTAAMLDGEAVTVRGLSRIAARISRPAG